MLSDIDFSHIQYTSASQLNMSDSLIRKLSLNPKYAGASELCGHQLQNMHGGKGRVDEGRVKRAPKTGKESLTRKACKHLNFSVLAVISHLPRTQNIQYKMPDTQQQQTKGKCIALPVSEVYYRGKWYFTSINDC